MRAIQFHRYGGPEVLRYEEVRERAPRVGEVRVLVHAAGVNPKDVLIRKGKMRVVSGLGFPQGLGHDVAGVVEAVGRGVKRLREGDEVYGMIPGWTAGAYAEKVTMSARHLALKPARATMEQAAGVPLAAMTALQALRDLLRVQPGEEVLLNGASGGVGVFAVQVTKLLGAVPVAVCSARNEGFVRELGASEVLPYDRAPLSEMDRTFDAFFDIFGSAPWEKARRHLGSSGRYVTTIPRPETLARDLWTRRSRKPARVVLVHPRPRDLSTLAKWIDLGALEPVVDRVYPIEAVADAHRYVETKRARGKVVLKVR